MFIAICTPMLRTSIYLPYRPALIVQGKANNKPKYPVPEKGIIDVCMPRETNVQKRSEVLLTPVCKCVREPCTRLQITPFPET
jgi:hypothetical protein